MFPYELYRLLHFLGVFLVIGSLAPLFFHGAIGGEKAGNPWRKPLAISHGVGLLLILLGGFGMLAKLGLASSMPGWVVAKLVIWVVLGGLVAFAYRLRDKGFALWLALIVLAVLAALLGGTKPF